MLPWIFLLLSALAWWVVFTTRSVAELAVALAAAVIFLVLGFFGLIAARVGHVTRTQSSREKALLLSTRPRTTDKPRESGATPVGLGAGGEGGSPGRSSVRGKDDPPGDDAGSGDGGGGGD
jgi:hypothetical protein